MPISSKSNKSKPALSRKGRVAATKVGSYEKDPFFVKKANDAKAFLKSSGLPKSWNKKAV